MNIDFVEANETNWKNAKLEVFDNQKSFVSNPTKILAKAYAFRKSNARAMYITCNDEIVGMFMLKDIHMDSKFYCSIDQFLIDKNHQGKGIGELSLLKLIIMIDDNNKYDGIELCYIKEDDAAYNLYRKCGFIRYPIFDDGNEHVMIYSF